MSGIFPTIEDGQVTRYPVQNKSSWVARVNQFADFSEQRWVTRQPLAEFVFRYRDVSRADVETLRNFFRAQKGAYDDFTLVFDGYEYQNMVFDQDVFEPVEESMPNRFSLELKLKQTRPNGWFWIPSPSDDTYPHINLGVLTQRPWTNGETFHTNKIDMETGRRYSYAWIQEPIKQWALNYPVITHDEAATLLKFFHKMHGRYGTFKFDDPEEWHIARSDPFSSSNPDPLYQPHQNCRFDMDDISLEYLGPNHYATKILITEFK